jgi:predicted protein tyrosine phosphatase
VGNVKSFRWCPQEIAANCYLEEDHSHVAIRSPQGRTITPTCGRKTFHQAFHDLDPAAILRTSAYALDSVKGQDLIDHCFTEAQAKELAAFVEPLDGLVVVNCEAGVSRSPGIVLALRRKYGGDTEECFRRACPNIHVASLLGRELGVGPFQAKPYEPPEGGIFFP